MAMTVENFLARFVDEEKHDEANDALSELFASMHCQMAKDFFKTYKPESPIVEEKPKKKAPAKKKEPKETKETKEKVLCKGVTGKGQPCKNKAVDGDFCRIHNKPKKEKEEKPKKEPKAKKEPKVKKGGKKKTAPEHNHPLSEEEVSDCEVCESHGNAANPVVEEEAFEAVDVQDKLKNMLESLGSDEGEDVFEADFAGCLEDDDFEEDE